MVRYVLKRLLWAAAMVFVVTLLTFVIFTMIPANPAQLAAGPHGTHADIERAEHYLGLDQPAPVQYGKFLWRLVGEQSLGASFSSRQDVNDLIAAAAPVTAALVFGGLLLTVLISVPLGVLSAVRRHSWLDRIGTGYVLVGASIPPVWLALMLSFFVGYKLGWAPISGYCDVINPATECGGPGDWAYHLLLPWLVLGGLGGALYVRMIRANVLETMNEDWVRTARAKGAPERRVLRRHVLRCSLLPFVTILGLDLGTALGGAVFVESVFGLPGLGQLALTSVNRFDLPVIQGIVVFVTLAILLCNLLVDLLYAALDPRIELEPSPAR